MGGGEPRKKNIATDSLPGCIGYFGKPIAPNNCQTCGWANVCKKVVAKERLAAILADVREAKAIVKGER
jgi:hypothetical protein